MDSEIKYDPIEDTEEYKNIVDELEQKIKSCIANIEGVSPNMLGFCHIYWKIKKELLKMDYNIDWESPDELNPTVRFD